MGPPSFSLALCPLVAGFVLVVNSELIASYHEAYIKVNFIRKERNFRIPVSNCSPDPPGTSLLLCLGCLFSSISLLICQDITVVPPSLPAGRVNYSLSYIPVALRHHVFANSTCQLSRSICLCFLHIPLTHLPQCLILCRHVAGDSTPVVVILSWLFLLKCVLHF